MAVISLKVEGHPGCSIEGVCEAMQKLSRRLEIDVDCQFNDVLLMAQPTGDYKRLVESYNDVVSSGRQHKYATSRGDKPIIGNGRPEPRFLTEYPMPVSTTDKGE